MTRATESSVTWDRALSSFVHRPVAVVLVPKVGLWTKRGHSR